MSDLVSSPDLDLDLRLTETADLFDCAVKPLDGDDPEAVTKIDSDERIELEDCRPRLAAS